MSIKRNFSGAVQLPGGMSRPVFPSNVKDGHVFTDAYGKAWIWDGFLQSWHPHSQTLSNGQPVAHNGRKRYTIDDYDEYDVNHLGAPPQEERDSKRFWKPKQCECGSEKVGSPMHSNWCPKYEKD